MQNWDNNWTKPRNIFRNCRSKTKTWRRTCPSTRKTFRWPTRAKKSISRTRCRRSTPKTTNSKWPSKPSRNLSKSTRTTRKNSPTKFRNSNAKSYSRTVRNNAPTPSTNSNTSKRFSLNSSKATASTEKIPIKYSKFYSCWSTARKKKRIKSSNLSSSKGKRKPNLGGSEKSNKNSN